MRTEAQEHNGGPRRKNEKALKDITNKLEIWPIIAKASRPMMKGNGGQLGKEVKILKRPVKVWRADCFNGPPTKIPYDKSISS